MFAVAVRLRLFARNACLNELRYVICYTWLVVLS
jgi:hypothetical protein